MHLMVRETHGIEEDAQAVDLKLTPAPVVMLSFSDSDLGAWAGAWCAARDRGEPLPAMRLVNLQKLAHPMSVDLIVEQVIEQASCVVVRLLGGVDYWRYGLEECALVCRQRGVVLAVVSGDGGDDPRLGELSSINEEMRQALSALLAAGGPQNIAHALALVAHLGGLASAPVFEVSQVPAAGVHDFGVGGDRGRPLAVIVFYRAYLLAHDFEPLAQLARALDAAGLECRALYVSSLKDDAAARLVRDHLARWSPSVVINATGFSARRDDGHGSPLDAAAAPVLQVALSGTARAAWAQSARGLSQADLAMQVVLPEFDGRLFADAISFKSPQRHIPELEFSWLRHEADSIGIARTARRVARWARLSHTARAKRRVGLILSDYPGAAGQAAHAVGLDALASASAILGDLKTAGYGFGGTTALPDAETLAQALCRAEPQAVLDLERYEQLFAELPGPAREKIEQAWGPPPDDPAVRGQAFCFRVLTLGNVTLAIQPDRGNSLDRKAAYHDPDLPPRHGFVAFYLWLNKVKAIDAMVHLGTHGTLEWLPGKAVAQAAECFPALLADGLPVLYPFIVNNPGEAAAAKRRLGAVTIGHMTPPLKTAGSHGAALGLEKLIDEYAAADGLDQRRMALLRDEILAQARDCGLLGECGADGDLDQDEQLARLDAYLCDVKDMQIRDGLHVFGRGPASDIRAALEQALQRSCPQADPAALNRRLAACAGNERAALLAGLDGIFVEPGPAGAPTRGRADVLPTGRNLFAVDPRAVPTRMAVVLAEKAAEAIIARHLQDHGDWPRRWFIDLWGSTTIRTGGEDFALALLLMGVRPRWDDGANRVVGFEIMKLAELGRPRADVTLRVSGLFRDAFSAQIALFDAAVRAVAALDEPAADNPLAAAARGLEGDALRAATARIYGAAPGSYGAGLNDVLARGAWQTRDDLGAAYLAAGDTRYGQGVDGSRDAKGLADRIRATDAFVHAQDHAEIDLLETGEYASFEGGFAAAAKALDAAPTLYHADISNPDEPVARTVPEEVKRIVRGKAANPAWIKGMTAHGFRGAAEIARNLDAFFAFAATLPERFDGQFELIYDATLGDEEVDGFLRDVNPEARAGMHARFAEAMRRDLWRPRRNSVTRILASEAAE